MQLIITEDIEAINRANLRIRAKFFNLELIAITHKYIAADLWRLEVSATGG